MQVKKVLATVMSLCIAAGAVSYGAPVISQTITAQAYTFETNCYSFDETTGTLTLKGKIDADTLRNFSPKTAVKSIVAEKGTVFPEDSSSLLYGYNYCTSIDLSQVDTSNVINMEKMLSYCSKVASLDLSGFDTSNVTNMERMFDNCSNLVSLDISGFDTSKVTNMSAMFESCDLTTFDLSGFDTSNVTDMSYMFLGCNLLSELDLSTFNTSKVTDMSMMFCGCKNLTSLNLGGLDTSNVKNMRGMLLYCNKLTDLDINGFDTCNVEDMGRMFDGCSNLTSLDLSGFDTSNVRLMDEMFRDCSSLKTLDLSSFDTSNVYTHTSEWGNVRSDIGMNGMFAGCSNLTTLDLSSFDTRKITDDTDMFSDCNELKCLVLGENFENITKKAELPNGEEGWVNANDPSTVISRRGEYAVIDNSGKNTYKRLPIEEETKPTNIKVEYSEKYHQVKFTWDKVEGADRYGIAIYLAGKWRVQTQNITDTTYTTPKNLTPGKTYKVAVAARVNGNWDAANAIKNAVTVTIK
jgi:surface protein